MSFLVAASLIRHAYVIIYPAWWRHRTCLENEANSERKCTEINRNQMNNCKMYVCSLVKIVSRCLKRRNTPKIDEIKKMEEKREKTNKQKSVSLSFRSNCACSGDVLLFCTLLFSHMCIFIVEWEILPIRMRKNIYV